MKTQLIETTANVSVQRFTLSELTKLCQLSNEEAQELIDYGVIKSDDTTENQYFYSVQKSSLLQNACKKRRDYDLELFAVVICMQYLEHISKLERQIESLQAKA